MQLVCSRIYRPTYRLLQQFDDPTLTRLSDLLTDPAQAFIYQATVDYFQDFMAPPLQVFIENCKLNNLN